MKTASSLHRIGLCPASYALRVRMAGVGLRRLYTDRTSSSHADAGTKRHATMEAAIDLGALPERFRIYVGEDAKSEVSYSYDSASGAVERLPPGIDRNYPEAAPTVTYGTTDCVSMIDESTAAVVDWKGPHADLPPILQNDQVMFAALGASKETGAEHVQIATVRLDDADPDADDDLPTIVGVPDVAMIGRRHLEVFEEKIRRLDGAIAVAVRDIQAGRDPIYIPGNHCAYCTAAPACPATNVALQLAASPEIASDLNPALLVEMLSAVDAAEKRLRAHVANVVETSGPIDLGDGYAYGPVISDGNEKIDAALAAPVLVESLGMAAELAIKKTVSKTGIKAAAKDVAPKGKAAALEKEIIGKLRSAGAVSRDKTTSLKVYRIADALPPPAIE